MKEHSAFGYVTIGFVAGMWSTFFLMRSVVVQEFGPTGLTGANATFNQLSNELLNDMAVFWIFAMGITLIMGIVLVVIATRQRHNDK